jgi:hypothetical protein
MVYTIAFPVALGAAVLAWLLDRFGGGRFGVARDVLWGLMLVAFGAAAITLGVEEIMTGAARLPYRSLVRYVHREDAPFWFWVNVLGTIGVGGAMILCGAVVFWWRGLFRKR